MVGFGYILRMVEATELPERLWSTRVVRDDSDTPIICLSTWVNGED